MEPVTPEIAEQAVAMVETLPERFQNFIVKLFAAGVSDNPQPDVPPWAYAAADRVIQFLFPTLTLREVMKKTLPCEARLMGHVVVLRAWMRENPDKIRETEQRFIPLMDAIFPYLERAMIQYLNGPTQTVTTFIEQFHFAASRTVDEHGNFKGFSDATPIYLLIALYYDEIAKTRNLAELHCWFTEVLGPNNVGSIHRYRRLTREIGLRYKAGRKSET